MWHYSHGTCTNQRNRIKNPEMNPGIYSPTQLQQNYQVNSMEEKTVFQSMVL